MRRWLIFIFLVGVIPSLAAACNSSSTGKLSSLIVAIQTQGVIADRELFIEVAHEFYKSHPDNFDMLVLWGAPEFAPGHSFYLPVKNDVRGIGYGHIGPEFFDDSADFGSSRLQGIVWMGPDWIGNPEQAGGPRSILGILAQETGHRWASFVYFQDPATQTPSSALLEDFVHWNFYLNSGASPMGGNEWQALGGSLFRAEPADHVEFCPLDLYLMGLVPADAVGPTQLLVNLRNPNTAFRSEEARFIRRISQPFEIEADVMEISIDQIIEVEGLRDPQSGFNAKNIRQAWIFVHQNPNPPLFSNLEILEKLQSQWGEFFSKATLGLGAVDTSPL